jgi:quinol-cytochrome oxidoreductase complex cytochrome b subunit
MSAPEGRDTPKSEATPGEGRAGGKPPRRADVVEWLEQRINLSEIFSFLTHFGLVFTPVDATRPFRDVAREVAEKRVPSYSHGPRVLALLAAIGFGIQAITGVLLACYYRPTPEAAFVSTRTIVRDLPIGWFLHQIHAWGAYLLIAVVVVRLLRLFWDALYQAPRELLWWSSVALVVLAFGFDFTGRLLTWDTHSYWSTVRGLEIVHAIPVLGPLFTFLAGGKVVNEDVLIRFYVLHIAVLPLAYAACIYLTVATLRKVGLSDSAPAVVGGRTTTFREHRLDLLIITLFLFAGLVTLGRLAPFRFLAMADPYSTPAGARPPWYMLAAYTVFQHVPGPTWIPGVVMLAVAFGVLLLPLWAPAAPTAVSERRLRIGGIVLLALWLALVATGLLTGRR